jgi:hypothetical protein
MYQKVCNMLVLALVFSSFGSALADDGPVVPVPDASQLVIPKGGVLVAPELSKATGPVQIVVRLVDAPLAAAVGDDAKHKGSIWAARNWAESA